MIQYEGKSSTGLNPRPESTPRPISSEVRSYVARQLTVTAGVEGGGMMKEKYLNQGHRKT